MPRGQPTATRSPSDSIRLTGAFPRWCPYPMEHKASTVARRDEMIATSGSRTSTRPPTTGTASNIAPKAHPEAPLFRRSVRTPLVNAFRIPLADFSATLLPAHILAELGGAMGATAMGAGDLFPQIMRVLVPTPFNEYGLPARYGVAPAAPLGFIGPAPGAAVTAESAVGGTPAPTQAAGVHTPKEDNSSADTHSNLYLPSEPHPQLQPTGSFTTARAPGIITAAFYTVQAWGATFSSRVGYVTGAGAGPSPVSPNSYVPATLAHAAFVVSPMPDLRTMYTGMLSHAPHGLAPPAFFVWMQRTAAAVLDAEMLVRSREALALAIGHALLLKELSQPSLAVAVIGTRFARVLALSESVVAVELAMAAPEGALFTIANILARVLDERIYDRLPNSLATFGDRAVEIICSGGTAAPRPMHFRQAIDPNALQRFLDLFATGHAIAEAPLGAPTGTTAPGRIATTLLNGAHNHPAPFYAFPNPQPRAEHAAVWGLQLAGVVVVEVPPELFDVLLAETCGVPVDIGASGGGDGHLKATQLSTHPLTLTTPASTTPAQLPTPLATAPSTAAVPAVPLPRTPASAPAMPADADLTAHTHSNSIMIMSPDSEGGNTLARTDGAHTPVTQIIINTLNAAVPTPTPQESAVRTDNANQRVPNNTPADHLPPACEAEGSNPKPKTRKTGTKPAKRRGKPTAASASTSFPNDANMNVTVGPSGSSTP